MTVVSSTPSVSSILLTTRNVCDLRSGRTGLDTSATVCTCLPGTYTSKSTPRCEGLSWLSAWPTLGHIENDSSGSWSRIDNSVCEIPLEATRLHSDLNRLYSVSVVRKWHEHHDVLYPFPWHTYHIVLLDYFAEFSPNPHFLWFYPWSICSSSGESTPSSPHHVNLGTLGRIHWWLRVSHPIKMVEKIYLIHLWRIVGSWAHPHLHPDIIQQQNGYWVQWVHLSL